MSTEPLSFNQVTSVKLPGSVGYIYNNLISHNDVVNNISYYAIINGFEVWIIKHFEPEKLQKNENKQPKIELRKVPFDKLESISAVKWCKFNNNSLVTFIICTELGKIYIYDFEGKKILYSHNINPTANDTNITINCVESNNGNLLFIGLSTGELLSFNMNDNGLTNKKLIFKCANNEAINCISKPRISKNKNNNHINNKMYIGCDDGSVIQYDFYSSDIDILIEKSNINKIMDENDKVSSKRDYNNCGSCICMQSCDDFVVIGYSSGFIKIVQKSELSFVIKQIAMHRRMVTSVAILDEMCLIATVSEDGYFHVIRNTTSSVDVIRSGYFENSILIGCKFLKTSHNSLYHQKYKDKILAVTAYDRNRIAFA
eukprot:497172_1